MNQHGSGMCNSDDIVVSYVAFGESCCWVMFGCRLEIEDSTVCIVLLVASEQV